MNPKTVSCILLVTALLAPIGSASASHRSFEPCLPGAKVLFINGVGYLSEQEVAVDVDELKTSIAHAEVTCIADVEALFNPSHGRTLDVISEVASQYAAEMSVTFGNVLLDIVLSSWFGGGALLSDRLEDRIRSRFEALIQSITISSVFTIGRTNYETLGLINQFRDRVLSELRVGTKTILVAHSQGNFFANETRVAVRGIAPPELTQGLAVVNVANASVLSPDGLWITVDQDWIIGVLLLRPTNFDANGALSIDRSGHGFSGIYLNWALPTGTDEPNSVAARVMALIRQALTLAQTPVARVLGSTSSGLFEIDLSSGGAAWLGNFSYTNSPARSIWDIALNPRTGTLHAISPDSVYALDRTTRALTRLPGSTVGGNALAFSAEGRLFGMGGNNIYRFDPQTGQATQLPFTLGDYVSSGDLTFDSDGILFGTAIGPDGLDHLVRIDVNRLTLAVVGSTGYSRVYGLFFSGGHLYGVTNGGTFLIIDQATGVARRERAVPFADITGLQ